MRYILRPFAIVLIKLLQYKYHKLTKKMTYNNTNQNISKIILLKHLLYYFKRQFQCWGYFHYDCTWSEKDKRFYNWLFPIILYKQNDFALNHDPEAVTYYHNRLYTLGHCGGYEIYAIGIKDYLNAHKLNR